MAYIYKIVNDINQKIYIGKTEFDIQKRFKTHCADAFRQRCGKRPLYDAMKKYGIEHFHIELIEETDKPEEREIYWIEQYGSFKNGYNATLGGEGKRYLDYDLIYQMWQTGKNIDEISRLLNYDSNQVSKALTTYNISHLEKIKRGRQSFSKPVQQINKDTGEIIAIYPSISDAARALGDLRKNAHISKVCEGVRETAYGFKWSYIQRTADRKE